MRRRISLGRVFGLKTTISRAGLVWYLGLALLAAVLARWLVRLPLSWAVLAGLLSAVVFFLSEWLHQAAHALTAWLVGYPMIGIHYFSIFANSLYPAEPQLPHTTHMRRALGGFWVNILIGLGLLPVAIYLWPRGLEILPEFVSALAWLAGFGVVTNLGVLGLGALLPIQIPGGGMTDGGTLVQHWLASRRGR